MASKFERKIYAADAHYHVYNRGINGMRIFHDDDDYRFFLNLLRRHLSEIPVKDKRGKEYLHLAEQIQVEAFCLMPNHFHLMVYQAEKNALPLLLQTIITPYVGYYNKKYERFGSLFQGVYKASLIYTESYFQHISRYIHLNPVQYRTYQWSSYLDYIDKRKTSWLHPEKITSLFQSNESYEDFTSDYREYKKMLDEIKYELADKK